MIYFTTDAEPLIDEEGDGSECVYFSYIDVHSRPDYSETLSLDDVFAEAANLFIRKTIPDAYERLKADPTLHLVGVTTTIEPPDKENWAEITRADSWSGDWDLPTNKSVTICDDALRLLDLDGSDVTSFWVRFYLVTEEHAKNWYPGGNTNAGQT